MHTCILQTKYEPSKADKGKADFTRYVAVGNSLTAGYSDGALYRSGQQNSYPAMLAEQFSTYQWRRFQATFTAG